MQHEQAVLAMTDIMAKFTNYLAKHLPDDIMDKLSQLRSAEESPLAKVIYDSMFENLAKADELNRPCCQDTGVIQFFVQAGAGFPLLSDVRAILDEAVREATQAAPLRHNAVEIFEEKNTGNNTGVSNPRSDAGASRVFSSLLPSELTYRSRRDSDPRYLSVKRFSRPSP